MSEFRSASSIILTRGYGAELEVYLVHRSPQLRFMGGFWAFPGGTVMEEDYGDQGPEAMDHALINCGVRELFEETGILLGDGAETLSTGEKDELRSRLLNDELPQGWLDLMQSGAKADDVLVRVCRITTPPFSPVRYRTSFLHAPLPDGMEPVIEAGELVAGQFMQPAVAVQAWERGELRLAPPNLLLLRLLSTHGLPDFTHEARLYTEPFENGALLPVYFTPGILLAPQPTPTLPPATTTNTLIVGQGKLYLVEPATYEVQEQQRLFDLMDRLTAQGGKFEAILLTHHHMDHIGAVTAVSRRYQLPVRAHSLTYDRIPGGYIRGDPLNEGDRIDLGTAPDGSGNWHLDVIATPGHAPDHLCYLESRYQAAIVGDMLSTASTILIDPPEGHMRTYLRSLERLLEYPIMTLYPSHGPVHFDGGKLIRRFLKHRGERELKLIKALTDTPRSIEELLPQAYDDVAEDVYPVAARSLLAGLIKLEEDGRCEQSGAGWKLKFEV